MNMLGKVLITISLTFQAFMLITDQSLIKDFNNSYTQVVKVTNSGQFLPDVALQYMNQSRDMIRMGTAGLLAGSVLLLIANCAYIAIFPIFGILVQILITSNILIDSSEQNRNIFIKNLVILGCVMLWATNNFQKSREKQCPMKNVGKQKKN